jgi:hypothetical protein
MKIIDYFKLKKLIQKQEDENELLNNLTKSKVFEGSLYSVWKSTYENLLFIYDIRLDRYTNGEDTGIHNGLESFVENLRLSNDAIIKTHTFSAHADNTTVYMVFTDVSVKNIIGVIEHL